MTAPDHLPLAGLTVVELSTMVTASLAAMMLGEQGARVIKIEPVDVGDPMRYIGTSKGGISGLFANCNRGKQAIRVDLKHPRGAEVVRRLAASADVLIHNYRPGVMDKLGLGSDVLRADNERLVYTAISGFGTDGPLGNAPAYDPIIQAHAGFAAAQGGHGTPTFIRNLMCDKITAYTACQAVTAALYQRERTGAGQHVDVAMLDAGLFFLFPDAFMNHTLLDDDAMVQPLLADLIYDPTLTQDGAITLSAGTPRQRLGVLRAIGREDLLGDDRFDTPEKLAANREAYRETLRAEFLKLPSAALLARLTDNDVPCAECLTLDDTLAQPQLSHNGTVSEQDHPLMGRIRVVRSAPRFSGEPLTPGSPCPAHGEHTRAVLTGIGMTDHELDELTAAGAIA